jgi:hypothetical protein
MSLKKKRKDDNHKEFAIGTKIEYNGKLYEVVEELFCDNCSIANICNNAEFTNIKKSDNLLSREQRYSIFGECSNYNRADGASVVFKEVPKDDSKYEYYKISPLWVYNNPVQLRPIELVLPNGHEIDVESSDLSKGIIRFKRKWLSLEQMYNMAKATNYHTCLSEIKDSTGDKTCEVREKLIALSNLMDIARYFNGNWEYHNNGDNCGYMIAYDKTKTTDDSYQVVHINSDTDMYFGNIMFKNEADAQYVINNPNFRSILDIIFKS